MASDAAQLRAQRDALNATIMRDWGSALGNTSVVPAGTSPRAGGQQHSSLLATPASRSQGGRLTQPPSTATLSIYERGLEAAAGYSRSPAQRAGAAAAVSSAALPPSRFTPHDPSPLRQQHSTLQRAATAAPDLARVLSSGASAAGTGGSPAQVLLRKPSLLAQHVVNSGAGPSSSLAASKAADLLASLGQGRPSPRAAAPCDSLQEAMQQMQLQLSRTAAANSAAASASSAGVTASPLRPASGLRPSQHAQHGDFRIPAAFPSSRLGAAPAAASIGSAARPPPPAATAAAAPAEGQQEGDGGAVAISMRLTPMFDAVSPSSSSSQRGQPSSADWGSPRHQVPAVNVPTRQAAQPAAWQEQSAASSPSTAVLASRVNELEAQLELERMRFQEVAAARSDLQQQLGELQQRAQAQAGAVESAQLRAAQAEARRLEATQQVAELRQEVERRKSAQSEGMESVARIQAVSDHHKQENEDLRQQVEQLGRVAEQEKEQAARLRRQLQAVTAAASPNSVEAQRLREREAEWERRLEEAQEAAASTQAELSSRCQLLAIEKVAHEQAAKAAAAKAAAAEQRLQAERARGQQLAEELDAAESTSNAVSEELAAARQEANAAAAAVRQLRAQLAEQQARCEELEAALAGERERSSSITARAETAEVAQQGLGSHVKAAHTRLQQLQEQVAAARREASQLQSENEELREAHLEQQSALQRELSAAQAELEDVRQERDQLQQRLAKASSQLDAQLQVAGQQRQQVAALQQAEQELQAALERQEACTAQQEACAAQHAQQVLALQQQVERLEGQCAQLESSLVEARQQALAAEAGLAKATRAGPGRATPLRDVVGGLHQELQEKDLQLMQAHEELAKERARGQELQQQVLDQAVELDDLQRDASDVFGLRQQIARLAANRDRLRDELDARDTEVMQLQGQLALLQAQVADTSDNWLSPLPDPL
ncbi:A-kinase anchor 9 isoform X1 [Chlorella sorokiniana]|uniref:A-kinase anchor 9 isoform X1 n=1 Tax=Chlorella sorokiniana TaxID=3076 RepID=A0A2P6TPC3_CHLSO|nr:A-kinase anchor 9 isoform X1 [Chlorella sorokiniana]|eukprot:PRW51181.1 A-kinase anchor 9 isoform X1 [Chlorella sorokiniana]